MTEQERIASVGAGVIPTYHATESVEEAKAVVEQCMSTNERLRKLLDERGVEWSDGTFDGGVPNNHRTFWGEGGRYCATECLETDLYVHFYATPEQAVEATLGRGTCHDSNKRFNAWQCSKCGATLLLMFDDYGEPTYSVDGAANMPRFCPNCGRKVVDA